MRNFPFCFFLTVFLSFALISKAQNIKTQTNYSLQFAYEIELINNTFDSIRKAPTNNERFLINKRIVNYLIRLFSNSEHYHASLDSLKRIGQLLSPDKKFRIISWNLILIDGTHRYFGFVQMPPEKNGEPCNLFALNDISYTYSKWPLSETFNNGDWFGALYYQIVPVKHNSETVYTLLATRFNNLFTTQKIIESLYFDNNNKPVFGVPIFEYGLKPEKRVIYEYSINAVMSMKYFEKQKMIILDHLSPPSYLYQGNYRFYGPDFSFDGFKYEKNLWHFYPNVNFKKQ